MRYHFVHIPRTGGHAIQEALKGCDWITFHGMGTDPRRLRNTIIVRRNERDRFASAVRWAIQNYADEPAVAALIEAGYTTPAQWWDLWQAQDPLVLAEILNTDGRHKIGRRTPPLKWTYLPTSAWFPDGADWEIDFENIREEFPQLVMGLTGQHVRLRHTRRTDRDWLP